MENQKLIERFEAELAKVDRSGMDKLLAYIRKSDFYTAPASTRFHLSCPGGLLQHSLNVLDALRGLLDWNEGTQAWEYGRWLIDENNRDPDNVINGIELISLAGLLSEYMAPAIIKVEYAPWIQELLALTDKREPEFDLSDEEIRECVLSLPHDDESALVADALIEILSGRDSQKALELYKEWKASDDSLSPAGSAEI